MTVNLQLKTMTAAEVERLYHEELVHTFPVAELKPLFAIQDLLAQGRYEPLGLYENDQLLGYALLWLGDGRKDYALLDYLGVTSARRNGGLGAVILQMLGEYYEKIPGFKGVFGECEAPGDPASEEYDLRCRRLGFYERCGLKRLDYDCAMFGVHYWSLILPTAPVDDTDALEAHRAIYQRQFSPEHYARYIQLPLAEGEALLPFTPWVEG